MRSRSWVETAFHRYDRSGQVDHSFTNISKNTLCLLKSLECQVPKSGYIDACPHPTTQDGLTRVEFTELCQSEYTRSAVLASSDLLPTAAVRTRAGVHAPSAFFTVIYSAWYFCMGAQDAARPKNGGFRPGQWTDQQWRNFCIDSHVHDPSGPSRGI